MIVCLCAGVDESELVALRERGVVGAEAIGRACDAGRHCGACLEDLDRLSADALDRRSAGGPRGTPPPTSRTLDRLDPRCAA